jgi:mono/diheme cytochrome c family protein
MNWFSSVKTRSRAGLGLAAVLAITAIYGASSVLAFGADTNAPAAKPAKPVAKKKLTGAELYAINCNRCHPERYATEFNAAQWKTLMLHMRVRANLPAKQAKEILKYLQEDAGN